MDPEKLQRADLSYHTNVVLKINAKLGGINHFVPNILPYPDLMVMGVDLYHLQGAEADRPSVAAVSAWLLPFDCCRRAMLYRGYIYICI